MDLLTKGTPAPAFSLADKDGVIHSLSDIDTKYTVIYFYPKDSTPGCTIEANKFSADKAKYDELGVTVVGISGGDDQSKTKFCTKHNLKILLLSDTDFKVSDSYGVYGQKSFMGKKYMGISRVTYVLDRSKTIINVYEKVKPLTHSKEVLEYIRGL